MLLQQPWAYIQQVEDFSAYALLDPIFVPLSIELATRPAPQESWLPTSTSVSLLRLVASLA